MGLSRKMIFNFEIDELHIGIQLSQCNEWKWALKSGQWVLKGDAACKNLRQEWDRHTFVSSQFRRLHCAFLTITINGNLTKGRIAQRNYARVHNFNVKSNCFCISNYKTDGSFESRKSTDQQIKNPL